MKSAWKSAILVFSFLSLLSACGGGKGTSGTNLPVPTWISGSNTRNQAGTYGTQGTAASSNVPGARSGAVSWSDSSGNPWLFGGYGHDSAGNLGYLNDLWKYDPTTLEWTWVSGGNTVNQMGAYGTQGTAAPSYVPGARQHAVSWLDSSGKLWLFGGTGLDSAATIGRLNDLWKYDPTTLEWTWVSGSDSFGQKGTYGTQGIAAPSNVPGARSGAVSWLDSSGKLWLFGGLGNDSAAYIGDLNDLWEYDPTTLEWTWVSGSSAIDEAGTYGTLGTAASANVPGARDSSVSWIDSSGKLWLFGGLGNDSAGTVGRLNDLWKYDPAALEWTWVSGSNTINQAGTYGTQGTAASANVPGARDAAVSWIDSGGKLWFFGGFGNDSAGSIGYLNDLWKYDPAALEWTWESGGDTVNKTGTYGTKGTAASLNVPGARASAVPWIDSGGKLWLFGGEGLDSAGAYGYLNDLWQFTP
jgi:N-acetylneuraminic acid mutarotase